MAGNKDRPVLFTCGDLEGPLMSGEMTLADYFARNGREDWWREVALPERPELALRPPSVLDLKTYRKLVIAVTGRDIGNKVLLLTPSTMEEFGQQYCQVGGDVLILLNYLGEESGPVDGPLMIERFGLGDPERSENLSQLWDDLWCGKERWLEGSWAIVTDRYLSGGVLHSYMLHYPNHSFGAMPPALAVALLRPYWYAACLAFFGEVERARCYAALLEAHRHHVGLGWLCSDPSVFVILCADETTSE